MNFWKALLLHAYYYGSGPYRWHYARRAAAEGRLPLVVLFYHRIADDRANRQTTSNATFRRQIEWLRRRCDLVSLEEVQRRIREGNHRPCVSITFDDGYAENCREAIPLLIRERIPCTYFVTLENVRDGKPFAHDLAAGQCFPPNTMAELRAMAAAGIEIGAHTYTHPDLGQIADRGRLEYEVVTAGCELAEALGRRTRYFAFPYGLTRNLNPLALELARTAGYEGVCMARGGYNLPGGNAFNLQRIHGDEETIRVKNWVTLDPRMLRPRARRTRLLGRDGAGLVPARAPGVGPTIETT
jgi:peptidoglycan/xylan/chitin deacetylase (PgdA/CDA1 family)